MSAYPRRPGPACCRLSYLEVLGSFRRCCDKKSLQADAVLQQQTTVNAQLAIQVKNQEDVLTQLVVQVSQENAQLLQAMQKGLRLRLSRLPRMLRCPSCSCKPLGEPGRPKVDRYHCYTYWTLINMLDRG